MNVLETFYYLFESDASKLDDGLKKSDRAAKGVEQTLDAVDRRAGLIGSSLLGLVKGLGAGLAAGLSAGAVMGMIRSTSDAVDAVDTLSQSVGVNVGELDAWGAAAASAGGGGVEALAQSISGLNSRVQDLVSGQSPALMDTFRKLGLSLDDVKARASDPLALLREMADGMRDLSTVEAQAPGKKLGLDPGTVSLMRQGKMGLDELVAAQKELGGISADQVEKNRAYRDALARMNRVFDDVRRRIVFFVLPALEKLANFFEAGARLAREHSGAIKWGVGVVALALTAMLVPSLLSAASASRVLLASLARFAPLAAGLALVALVAEDLYEFMSGNDSVTGELAKKWPLLGDAIHGVGNVLAWLIDLVGSAGAAIVTLFTEGPEAAVERFREGIRRIAADVQGVFPSVEGLGALVEAAGETMLLPFRSFAAVVEGATVTIAALIHEGPLAAFRELDNFVKSLGERFPTLQKIADAAVGAMRAGVRGLVDLWRQLVEWITRAVSAVPGVGAALQGAAKLFGGRSKAAPGAAATAATPAGVAAGQAELLTVSAAPVGNVSSAAVMAGATSNRSTSVQVDRVEVTTAATDAQGIAQGIGGALEREMRSAADAFDDGVAA